MRKLLFFIVAALMATACTTTKTVTVERVRTDTVYKNTTKHDSIFIHDSIHVRERGDTVLIEKWHTKYVDRLLMDTIYQSRVDSVPVPYPVTEYVEKQLTWWQRTQMYSGDLLLLALLGGLIYIVWYLWKHHT